MLTMLGVVIGVGSVIAMIGIGEGTKRKSLENIEQMGTNMLVVFPNWRRGHETGVAGADVPTLYPEDVKTVERVPTVSLVTGSVDDHESITYRDETAFTSVTGAEPQVQVIRNCTNMDEGTWYTMDDEASCARKCVLGYQVYQELFPDGGSALGKTVRIKSVNFDVVGVIASKGGSGFWNPDDQVYIPLKTAMTRLMGKTHIDDIFLQATYADLMAVTQQQVEDALGKTRKNTSGEPLFRVMNQGDAIDQMQTQSQLLSVLLAGIASVSLLVGGIGIMNIMLVSVTERTREIGLRKAIGARSRSILWQFLLESVVMCLVGGLIGIVFGLVGTYIVAAQLQVPPLTNQAAILMAFGFSAGVGLFFGLYPAMRASRLQPIDALRYE